MKKAVSAGGTVIKKERGKKLILLLTHPNGLTRFSKGHVKENESIENAAIREVSEETGLRDLEIVKKIGVVTREAIEDSGEKVIKDIHLFLMKTKNYKHYPADELYTWVPLEEAVERMYFKEEKDFLRKIIENSF